MAEAPNPPRKPRRWLRRLGVICVLLIALAWFAPTILVKTGLLNPLIAKATAKVNGHVSIGGISLGWFAPIVLTDVKLSDPDGKPILTVPTVRSSHSLLSLARNQADLGTFTIENPQLDIVCMKDSTNLEVALDKILNDPTPSTGSRPTVVVQVTNGTLAIRDEEQNWSVKGLDVTATIPKAGEAIQIQAKGAFDDATAGTLDADVSLGNGIVAKLKTNGFPLEMVAPFARRFEPDFQAAGRLTADLDANFAGGQPISAKAAGSISIADLDVGSARFGNERLKLKSISLPCVIETTAAGIKIEKADLTCDVGTASFSGLFDPNEPIERWIDRAGLTANADLDVAKLSAMFPKLFRLREGTALGEGRITAKLASAAGPNGTAWNGTLGTSALRGTRDGKPLAWDQPLTVSFAGRLTADRMPSFDRLDAKAEFATLSGSGTFDNFTVNADVSLDQLTRRLGEFIDLSGLQLAGTAKIAATGKTANGNTKLDGSAKFANLAFSDGIRKFQEADLTATLSADGTFFDSNGQKLNAATVKVTAGTETAEVRLLEPIADMKKLENGKAVAKITGDLERWVARASSFVSLPRSIKAIGGQGTLGGNVTISPATFVLDTVTADLKNARFHGYGIKLDEPQLFVDPTNGTIDRKTGLIEFPTLMLRSSTVAAAVKPMRLVPQPDGSYGIELDGVANANLARVQQLLQMQSDPQLGDRLDGIVAAGTFKVKTVGDSYTFDANLPIQKFVLGHPQKPTWTEEKMSIVAKGAYDIVADNLQLERAVIERPDGLKADAAGRINKATTVSDVDVSGKLTYDLATLEPQLKKFLGQSFQVTGKDARDFKVAGRLSRGVEGLTVSASAAKQAHPFGDLNGNASLAWQSLKAYGFDVGQSQLSAKLDRGVMIIDPLEASFGQTGKVRLEPTLKFLPTGNEIIFAKGKVIDQAKLTPAACADAVGYVLPAFARSTETSGTISFDIDDNRIPLGDPDKGTMAGRLTLHEVQIGPGPVIAEILQLLGTKNTTLSLNKDNKPQVVNVKLENGWVYHENLTLATKNFTMVTTGRVSLNGELEMVADVPLPDADVGALLKNNPKIREALAKKRIKLPVRGTINKPQLDLRAFRTAVKGVTDEIVRDLGKNALGGLLDKLAPPKK